MCLLASTKVLKTGPYQLAHCWLAAFLWCEIKGQQQLQQTGYLGRKRTQCPPARNAVKAELTLKTASAQPWMKWWVKLCSAPALNIRDLHPDLISYQTLQLKLRLCKSQAASCILQSISPPRLLSKALTQPWKAEEIKIYKCVCLYVNMHLHVAIQTEMGFKHKVF